MVFAYYQRLSVAQKRIYRQSDEITHLKLSVPALLQPAAVMLEQTLADATAPAGRVEKLCHVIAGGMAIDLGVPDVRVKVFAVRPHDDEGELHGAYTPACGRRRPLIELWMRTARRKRIVAFRTFLRTLLHEMCHHLDYTLLGLEDSLHTQGFYQREASLFRQLVP